MDLDEDYNLYKYLHAARIIERLEAKKRHNENWWQRTTLTTRMEWHPLFPIHAWDDPDKVNGTLETRSINLEQKADEMDAACCALDQMIARWRMRDELFHDYLDTLSCDEMDIIARDYANAPQKLRDAVQSELWEIETYVAFHFGYEPPDDRIDVTGDLALDVSNLATFFQEVSE